MIGLGASTYHACSSVDTIVARSPLSELYRYMRTATPAPLYVTAWIVSESITDLTPPKYVYPNAPVTSIAIDNIMCGGEISKKSIIDIAKAPI